MLVAKGEEAPGALVPHAVFDPPCNDACEHGHGPSACWQSFSQIGPWLGHDQHEP